MIANLVPGYFQAKTGEVPDRAFRRVEDFLPKILRPKKRRPDQPTAEQIARSLGCIK